ncbi:hypothetical protein BH23BAC2_BH23BAC2_00400 [soil metagenome]
MAQTNYKNAEEAEGLQIEETLKNFTATDQHNNTCPIPLISDPEKQVYKKYGIESSTLKMMSTFLR